VLRLDWLGETRPSARDAALAELARRYLRAFGPATEGDFAGWAGLGLRDIREALAAIGSELVEMRIGDQPAWALRGATRRPRERIVRLLPGWDTYLMGHRDRRFLASPDDWRRIMPGGGILRPAIVVDGAIVGMWSMRRRGSALEVELEPFATLDASTRRAVEAEADDVRRFEEPRGEFSARRRPCAAGRSGRGAGRRC
jgi:hypothetical protein